MIDANCSYVSGATRPFGVDFSAVAEESKSFAGQIQRRQDAFFTRIAESERKLDAEFVGLLEQEREQRWQRIALLNAELALAWDEQVKTDEALEEAKRRL